MSEHPFDNDGMVVCDGWDRRTRTQIVRTYLARCGHREEKRGFTEDEMRKLAETTAIYDCFDCTAKAIIKSNELRKLNEREGDDESAK